MQVVAPTMLMPTSPSAKPIPATIGTAFGGLWALVGAFALPMMWRWPVAAVAAIITGVLVARLWRRRTAVGANQQLFVKAPYRLAVFFEVVAIAAASMILPRLGAGNAFVPVVGVIVGLHFIGLWFATRSRRFLTICICMCGVSMCALLAPEMSNGFALRGLIVGFGNALVLWLGASQPAPSTADYTLT